MRITWRRLLAGGLVGAVAVLGADEVLAHRTQLNRLCDDVTGACGERAWTLRVIGWRRMRLRLLTILVVGGFWAAGCGGSSGTSGASGGTSGGAGDTSALDTALRLAPAGSGERSFAFSDLRAVQSGLGQPLPPGSDQAALSRFDQRLGAVGALPVDGPEPGLWTEADVDWVADNGFAHGGFVHVTQLRQGFGLGPLEHKLSGCGYPRSQADGYAVYAGTSQTITACRGGADGGVPQEPVIAVDADDHRVVTGFAPDMVKSALGGAGDLRRNADAAAAIKPLSGDAAIAMQFGPGLCGQARSGGAAGASPAVQQQSRRQDPPGRAYRALAFGLQFTPAAASATLVFRYGSPTDAKADVRERVARLGTGTDAATSTPYRTLLTPGAATTDGATATIALTAPPGRPLPLSDMLLRDDLGFASC